MVINSVTSKKINIVITFYMALFSLRQRLFLLSFCLFFSLYSQSIKLITYNIRLDIASDSGNAWKYRKDFLFGQLTFYSPDIFGIQEALPNQVNDFKDNLSDYNCIGIARDGLGKGEASNIFFKKDIFQVLKSGTFWLSETPDTISKGLDAALNRVCTYALLKHSSSKKKIWVFNTHLDHVGEIAKTKSIALILSRTKLLNPEGFPVVLMGDFNSTPESTRIIDLKSQMNDSREVAIEKPFGPYGTFNGFHHEKPVSTLIDYIFISKSKHLSVKKYAVLSDSDNLGYPSDHLPVFVELILK